MTMGNAGNMKRNYKALIVLTIYGFLFRSVAGFFNSGAFSRPLSVDEPAGDGVNVNHLDFTSFPAPTVGFALQQAYATSGRGFLSWWTNTPIRRVI